MEPSEASADAVARRNTAGLVIRNTVYLTLSQALTVPISVLVNAMMGRYLGPEAFGHVYFATTLATFGFLAIEWGHSGALPTLVARDHSLAGGLLATSLAFRAALVVVVYLVLALGCWALGYGADIQWALGLVMLALSFTSVLNACKDVIRGFERTDIGAVAHVAQQLLVVALVVPVLMLGGRMRAALIAQAAAAAIVLPPLWRQLGKTGVGSLGVSKEALHALFRQGTPFVFLGLAMVLQPNIDALYLSKLAPPEVMGWFAAARRLVGVLLFPAAALIGSLFPTLSRLYANDEPEFRRVSAGALKTVSLLVVPLALGCGLYPDIGIAIFSRESFGPAEDNLRVMSVFLFLVYFSMPLGTCLMVCGRQRAWASVLLGCVVVSAVLDPLLIPYFQRHHGNGGLGVCVAGVLSELMVVIAGLAMLPAGIRSRDTLRTIGLALLSGVAMVGAALLMAPITSFVAAPLAVVVYVVALKLTGGLEQQHIDMLRGLVARKLLRKR
jgi:O-antigen/teichoic acid export membrane protein